MTKAFSMQLKTHKCGKEQGTDNTLVSTSNNFKNQDYLISDRCTVNKKIKPEESDTYKSILKLKRTEFQESVNKLSNEVADRLVAQIVTRAQRLRGDLFKETYDEDEFSSSDNSINNGFQTHVSAKNKEKLYECVLCKDMMSSIECKTCTLKSTTLHPSLTDLASSSLKTFRYDNKSTTNNTSSSKMKSLIEDALSEKKLCIDSKGLLNF